jgi:hypothetical protein
MSFFTPNGSQTKLNEFGASLDGANHPHPQLDEEVPEKRRWRWLRGRRREQNQNPAPSEPPPGK